MTMLPPSDSPSIFISGGAGGMGVAVARHFAQQGARIVLADVSPARLAAAIADLPGNPDNILPIQLDVRDAAACRAAIEQAVSWAGGLDVLINAAGIWLEGPAEDVSEDAWDRVMDVNLKGAFFLCSAAIPHLAVTRGTIINVASDAGLVGNNGAAVYCASKGGMVLLTKALALELAPRRIRVNAICPGDVATQMVEDQARLYGGGDPDGYKQRLLAHYPQGEAARFIKPDEIASFIAYLCSPAAAPITGAALSIDFGVTSGY